MAYCQWYDKELQDVYEHEQMKCYEEVGMECQTCRYLKVSESDTEESEE